MHICYNLSMTKFTPYFLARIGTEELYRLIDISLLESKLNGQSVADNLFECLRDVGFNAEASRQNSEHIVGLLERGVFWTRLSAVEYCLPVR